MDADFDFPGVFASLIADELVLATGSADVVPTVWDLKGIPEPEERVGNVDLRHGGAGGVARLNEELSDDAAPVFAEPVVVAAVTARRTPDAETAELSSDPGRVP